MSCKTLAALLIMADIESDRNTSEQQVHYILIDRNGPLAEFETWEDAFHCMSTRQVEGGSIVRCAGPMGEKSRSMAGLNGRQAGRSTPEQSASKATKKVLVISEDVSTLLEMAHIVKVAGHGVTIGRSAAEAVQTIGLERPDLVIVDVDRTAGTTDYGWEGLHVVEWLRCHYPDQRAKYIAVSGADPEKFNPRTAGVDACALVAKPIVKASLLAEISRAFVGPAELPGSPDSMAAQHPTVR
jgi:ActR/RegA family two-component response regulator